MNLQDRETPRKSDGAGLLRDGQQFSPAPRPGERAGVRSNFGSTALPAGTGHLGVELVSGQSAVTSLRAVSPLKILVSRPRGPTVWAFLASLGGGLVAGDEIKLTLTLGDHARCFLGTQASMKVYRNPTSRPCSHYMRARLGRASLLAFAPDPTQAFTGSRYQQRQEFHLHPESALVLVDWLCSGRAACGERWAFNSFQSRNEVFLGDSRVLLDSVLMDPADGPLDSAYRMGRFNCLALVLVFGDSLRAVSKHILEQIAGLPIRRRASLVCSANPIAHGVLVRIAGEDVEAVGREIRRLLAFLRDMLHDDPWSRKW